MSRSRFRIRWLALSALAGGVLFQTTGATSCSDYVLAGGVSLMASVINAFIGNTVNHALGLTTTLSGLST